MKTKYTSLLISIAVAVVGLVSVPDIYNGENALAIFAVISCFFAAGMNAMNIFWIED